MDITTSPAWQALADHRDELASVHLRTLFAEIPTRFQQLSKTHEGLLIDYSKQRLTPRTMTLLNGLADAAGVDTWRARMFAGERINESENRAVLHPALRAAAEDVYLLDGHDVVPAVLEQRARLRSLCDSVRAARCLGFSDTPIRHVVNIGIGGSDLGPRMAFEALSSLAHPALSVHFVANLDGADLAGVLERLDPRATLFVIASKSFTTLETLINAQAAKRWLLEAAGDARDLALARHFVAVTANPRGAEEFGVSADRLFPFDDWVGGRFSLWSSIGLPLALSIGMDAFEALLAGARKIDLHFRNAPLNDNLPVLMALIDTWNSNFLGATARSVSPYSHALRLFPAYLLQLEMESNGKRVSRAGVPLDFPTIPVVFGEAGSNAQHAYFQALHQSGRFIPSEFIAVARSEAPLPGQHEHLLANCLAQSAALAFGSEADELPHRRCPGNQPSSTIVLPRLDPENLGKLLALYEHKVFVQGILWGVNSFDQWGVELGKHLGRRLLPLFTDSEADIYNSEALDASTCGIATHIRTLRAKP